MADIKNIDVFQTVTSVSFEVEPNTNIININKVTTSGYSGIPNLQEVTDIGAITTNGITANSFIKSGGTGLNALLDNGSTVALSTIGGATNLSPSQTATNFTINSDTGTDATIPLGNGTLAGATLNDYTTAEKNKLAGIEAGANLGVPYTGATSDVNLGEFGIQLGNLEFDNTPTNIPTAAGSVYYNDADGTLDLILKGGNVTLQVGQETVIRVVNKTATNVSLLQSDYQAVRITGAQGQRPKVDLAQATNDVLSAETIGLVTETITNNQEGFITTSGLVRNINTTGSIQGETWLDGDVLYLSPTVAGGITKVKPIAPNHLIIIGYVISAHITQGTIFVKVDNGYELNELHNVKINGVANNNVLAYTSSTSIWENKTISTVLGYTPANDASVVHLSGNETIAGDKTFTGTTAGITKSMVGLSNVDNTSDANKPISTATQTALNLKVDSNTAITGATKTKITYDSKGLVTAGADATTADIADSINKRYVTDANLTVIGNTSGTNTGDNATNTQYSGLATSKQDTLQSTVNIKSINGNSILGSGDLTISASPTSQSAFTILANNTNAAAVPTEQVYKDIAEQIYTGSPTWTGTAPTTILANTYKWNQVGSLVTIRLSLSYNVGGSNATVLIPLPTDLPTPSSPTGFTGALDILYYGTGTFNTSTTAVAVTPRTVLLRRNSANNGYEFLLTTGTSISIRVVHLTLQYFT